MSAYEDDEIFTAAMAQRLHEIEQAALVPGPFQQRAILCLVDAGRKMRAAASALLHHETDYRDGWIDAQHRDAFRAAISHAYDDGDPFEQ